MLKQLLGAFRERFHLSEGFTLDDMRATWATTPVDIHSFQVSDSHPSSRSSQLAQLAQERKGEAFLKWWQYFDAYSRELDGLAADSREGRRASPLKVLEIGVWRGGSLGLWRDYFGPDAVIFGVDIDPNSARHDGKDGSIRIGSQIDDRFMNSVVAEMGGVDVVIDDGSHVSGDVIHTLRNLWPQLSNEGLYFVEDLHTSYWPAWGGGLRRSDSSIEALKSLVDVLHQPYFQKDADAFSLGISRDELFSATFYDSVAVLSKKVSGPPRPFRGGSGD